MQVRPHLFTDLVTVNKLKGDLNQFSALSIAKNGRILVSYFQQEGARSLIYSSFSDDKGETFSDAVQVSDF